MGETPFKGLVDTEAHCAQSLSMRVITLNASHQCDYQHCTSYNVAQAGIVGSVFDDYLHQATQPSAFMIATILFLETIIIPNIVRSSSSQSSQAQRENGARLFPSVTLLW